MAGKLYIDLLLAIAGKAFVDIFRYISTKIAKADMILYLFFL
jgi:hypothetical protein